MGRFAVGTGSWKLRGDDNDAVVSSTSIGADGAAEVGLGVGSTSIHTSEGVIGGSGESACSRSGSEVTTAGRSDAVVVAAANKVTRGKLLMSREGIGWDWKTKNRGGKFARLGERYCGFGLQSSTQVICSPYSSVVERPLSKRKVGSSILPGGIFIECLVVLYLNH